MAPATQISPAGRASIAFELERFAHSGERLEVSGRWLGVRGRRFMRPTLTLRGPDGESRALADLEHKPWAAEDGETWQAAFPNPFGSHTAEVVEMSVAPDIILVLPAPDVGRPGRRPARPRRRSGGRQPAVKEPDSAVTEPRGDESVALRRELDGLRTRSREQLERIARLETELAVAKEAGVEAAAAVARRDAAVKKLDALLAEHDALAAARDGVVAERDGVVAERDGLASERDSLLVERDKLLEDREAAATAWKGSGQELEAALQDLAATRHDLTTTQHALDGTQATLEEAIRARHVAEADATIARRERDEVLNSPENLPLPTPPVLVRSSFRRSRLGSGATQGSDGAWLTRAIAVGVVIVVLLALLLVLRGL